MRFVIIMVVKIHHMINQIMMACDLVATSALKVETVYSSEMLVSIYQTTWSQNPENHNMNKAPRKISELHKEEVTEQF
jgi:hypothetical protein